LSWADNGQNKDGRTLSSSSSHNLSGVTEQHQFSSAGSRYFSGSLIFCFDISENKLKRRFSLVDYADSINQIKVQKLNYSHENLIVEELTQLVNASSRRGSIDK
jgi:hypothetical protein